MRVYVYRDRCSAGHVQHRPFSRNLAFVWGARTLAFRVRYNSTGSYYVCTPCTLGYERGEG